MKKFLLSLLALAAMAVPAAAQNYLDIYQGGRLAGSVLTADADSVYVTGDDPASRRIHFASGGRLLRSYLVADIDSIKVFRADLRPWVFLGILGFNQELYERPIGFFAASNSNHYANFVGDLPLKDGTLLYYGVEHALDMLAAFPYHTPYSSVNLITFTDGLDQGSFFMTDRYSTEADYLGALNRRILNDKVQGLPITAYSLGLRGNDVSDYAQFQANLCQLASAADKATEVSSMSDVSNRLQSIADEIISTFYQQTFSLKIPDPSNGTQVCFTFDGLTPDQSTLCIEGTFNLSDRSLRNVTYRGIRAATATTVAGQQQGIFVTYTFTGLQRLDGNGLIPTSNIRQYNRSTTSSTWQVNSEFTPANNTQTTITHAGTVILLVLDCSSSLGSQFSDMKRYAIDFISRLTRNGSSKLVVPQNVTASLDEDEKAILVQWDAVKYAERYDVYRSSSASDSFTKVVKDVKVTSWVDENPLEGTSYYRVVAKGHGMTSSQSQTSNAVDYNLPLCPDGNHPHMIDLGIGTLWSCCNVGASAPEHYGDYYAWGETSTKSSYSWSTYVHCNGSYSTCHNIGSDISGTSYDAATVNWGAPWRLPTLEEGKKLLDSCTHVWTTYKGVKGCKFTGPNGNSMFLPASGYRWYGEFYYVGSSDYYWSSTLYGSRRSNAYGLHISSGGTSWLDHYRSYGFPVRPVR